jgi:hypothetical protein
MYIHDIFSGWLFVNYQLKYALLSFLKQGVKTHMNNRIIMRGLWLSNAKLCKFTSLSILSTDVPVRAALWRVVISHFQGHKQYSKKNLDFSWINQSELIAE